MLMMMLMMLMIGVVGELVYAHRKLNDDDDADGDGGELVSLPEKAHVDDDS